MELKIVFLVVLVLVFASAEKVKSRDAPSPVVGDDYQDPWYEYCASVSCETKERCGFCSGQCVDSYCRAY
ncbi:hypothetical protein ABFS83_07G070700 [Erythranthe nasuta]